MTDSARPIEGEIETGDAARDAALGRLAVRLSLGGFALMFAAAGLLWVKFGPSIFMDLATAVVACF